jgi:hypothetical protein
MTTGMTVVLAVALTAAAYLAVAGMWTWLGRLRADRPAGRHRPETVPVSAVDWIADRDAAADAAHARMVAAVAQEEGR